MQFTETWCNLYPSALRPLIATPPERVHRRTTRRSLVLTGAALVFLLSACASPTTSSYETSSPARRDTQRAEELNRRAADAMDSNPQRAEGLLKEALAADLFCGPAHNNLGVLCLEQGRTFEAASEFEWARKLMPGHPDPRINLSLCFAQAGRADEAIAMCRDALAVYPDHPEALQQLALLQIRYNRIDVDTPACLSKIASGPDATWRDWARAQEIRLAARR